MQTINKRARVAILLSDKDCETKIVTKEQRRTFYKDKDVNPSRRHNNYIQICI